MSSTPDAEVGGPSRWRIFLPYLPPALLCLVAILQIYLSNTSHLTPWKGGGFGMFSTNDSERLIRIWTRGTAGWMRFTEVGELSDARRAGEFPTHRRLRKLAHKVAAHAWDRGSAVSEVRIQVWGPMYEIQTMAPDSVLLREITVFTGSSK